MPDTTISAEVSSAPIITVPHPLAKAVLDYVGATLLLIFLAVPFLVIALLIKIDSHGPVFFRQPRLGLNNRVFSIWKFRTMRDSEADMHGIRLTDRNDDRITRVGHHLRKLSIDELPQLINVLAGQMSLVGPRPHAIQAKAGTLLYADAVPAYHARHQVLPGITGWAQVNGWRGETRTVAQIEQRVMHDLEYIRRLSLWFDIRILFLTAARLRSSHVY